MSRHYHVAEALAVGQVLPLDAGRFLKVLRLGPGDEVDVVDKAGALFRVRLCAGEPLEGEVIASLPDPGRDATHPVEVWVPLLKGGRTDDLVRQLTELGVSAIVPFESARAVVRVPAKKADERRARLEAIATQAANQCGRLRLPELAPVQAALPESGPGLFFWEEGGRPAASLPQLISALWPENPAPRLLFGPEGGLSHEEAAYLTARGWVPVSLGPRILRAETAVLVGTTLTQQALGAL